MSTRSTEITSEFSRTTPTAKVVKDKGRVNQQIQLKDTIAASSLAKRMLILTNND